VHARVVLTRVLVRVALSLSTQPSPPFNRNYRPSSTKYWCFRAKEEWAKAQ